MATTEQMKAIVAQATAFFEARDELSVLEQAISDIIEDDPEDWDWSHLATEIIDTIRHAITNATSDDSFDIDALRDRFEEISDLPIEWWNKDHPMFEHLDEFREERRDLHRLFDEFDSEMSSEEDNYLHPISKLGEYVADLVCERSGINFYSLDPVLRASIDLTKLVDCFKAEGGTVIIVEFRGSSWFLIH